MAKIAKIKPKTKSIKEVVRTDNEYQECNGTMPALSTSVNAHELSKIIAARK
jgi:hypothetical protein